MLSELLHYWCEMTTLTVTRRLRGKVRMTRRRERTVMRTAQRPGQSVR